MYECSSRFDFVSVFNISYVFSFKMPTCIALGCSNTSGRLKERTGFFQVPMPKNEDEKKRAARWLHNIGTGHTLNSFKFNETKKVCEDHFHPDCFERNLQAEMLGYTAKKKLKPAAIPTIFSFCVFDQIDMDGTVASKSLATGHRIKCLKV